MPKPQIAKQTVGLPLKDMSVSDIIAPESLEVDFDFVKINNVYFRTIFIAGYPRFVAPGWLEP